MYLKLRNALFRSIFQVFSPNLGYKFAIIVLGRLATQNNSIKFSLLNLEKNPLKAFRNLRYDNYRK
ncbi:MAG: hypothetical protein UR46_C0021G0004 [Parcubacteria group bacterium GW2011_GWA1_33_6]|nr:MAG: hypothetical protein UR31_C0006G0008 [Parcubacteria group bacterium GW2011_GWA2_33_14]KKP54447.1 MAG: hypothetical protein UR46_C0021G0004 [Parcubacteria group bacterium GW2011_GWA1_33_6]